MILICKRNEEGKFYQFVLYKYDSDTLYYEYPEYFGELLIEGNTTFDLIGQIYVYHPEVLSPELIDYIKSYDYLNTENENIDDISSSHMKERVREQEEENVRKERKRERIQRSIEWKLNKLRETKSGRKQFNALSKILEEEF